MNLNKPSQGASILGNPRLQPTSRMPYQKVTEAQMQRRRRKGLCYFCEEKWHQGYKCLKPKLYLLEGMEFNEENAISQK